MKISPSLNQILSQVPPDYYDKGIKNNVLQRIWHTNKFKNFKLLTQGQSYHDILDIGCAGGTLTSQVKSIFPKSNIIAIDAYKDVIKYAQKRHSNIKFITADANNLPFKNDSFDLVFSYETLEHVSNPSSMLSEIRRVLKDDGRAIIALDSGVIFFRIIWWFWERTKGRPWYGAHLSPFNHKKMESLIKKQGFTIIKKHFSHMGLEVSFLLKK